MALFQANLRAVNPTAKTIELSARTGDGVDEWCDWLRKVTDAASDRTHH
jgi:hydrogenase nickel incorporation protein HypB